MAPELRTTHLVAWIGRQDLDGIRHDPPAGPVVGFLRARPETTAVLLSDWPKEDTGRYIAALRECVPAKINVRPVKLTDPTDYLGILHAADAALNELAKRVQLNDIAIHTSPGTSPMAAVWVRRLGIGKTDAVKAGETIWTRSK